MNLQKLKNILLKNGFLKVISLLLAFIAWVTVAISTQIERDVIIRDVPIRIDLRSAIIEKQGLNLIDTDAAVTDVKVSGKLYIVSGLKPEDVTVNASLSTISGAGEYELKLEVESNSSKDFTIDGTNPEVVKARFDKLIDRKFPITVDFGENGVKIPEGYMMLENPQVVPGEITIRGPEVQLDAIERVAVPVDIGKQPISKDTTINKPIVLYDQDNNPIKPKDLKLEFETADVKISVYKTKEVPLVIDYTSLPANFPADELEYTISNQSIMVAGPTDQVDNLTKVNVGYVNLSELTPDNNVFHFDVVLPARFNNLNNIETVSVEFNTEGMIKKSFYINNLKAINVPAGYDVALRTKQLSNVEIIGPRNVVEKLTAKDIVGEIDLSDRQIASGEIGMPVNVIVPGKGLVWATGDYKAVVIIKEK